MPGRQRNEQVAVKRAQRGGRQNQAAIRRPGERGDAALDVAGIAQTDRVNVDTDLQLSSPKMASVARPLPCADGLYRAPPALRATSWAFNSLAVLP